MIYQFSLYQAGLAVGVCLLLISLAGLTRPALFRNLARQLPRSRLGGVILFSLVFIWSLWLVATMEMGEFNSFRRPLLIALPIGFLLVLRFLGEFLAVRALGILCLLAAEPLLDAAFLRYEPARLVVTVFAYLLVIAGLFWVTMPYLLRDQINWTAHSNGRWRFVNGIVFLYGAVTLVLAVTQY